MSRGPREEPCPYCGEPVSVTAARCRACGRGLTEDGEPEEVRPRRRPPRNTVEATDFLVPTHVSGWALASCYLGLIGFCLPLFGLAFAIPAVVFGIIALRTRKERAVTYGAVTSNIRAIIGLVLGSLATVGWSILLVYLALHGAFR